MLTVFRNLKRERGNYWYSRCDYPSSIQCYRRALEYLDTENETETVLYLNRETIDYYLYSVRYVKYHI